MVRIGDPCTTCVRRKPAATFTLVRGKNRGSRRNQSVRYRPNSAALAGVYV